MSAPAPDTASPASVRPTRAPTEPPIHR
jgi:hypothetical protein